MVILLKKQTALSEEKISSTLTIYILYHFERFVINIYINCNVQVGISK
jgi:hypothetical protein